MKTILPILLFGCAISGVTAQINADDKYAQKADHERILKDYIKQLQQEPLQVICLDSLDKNDPTRSQEWLVEACGVQSVPRWSIGASAGGKLILPRMVQTSAGTDMYEGGEVKYFPSSGFAAGADFQYFFFGKEKVHNPFIPHPNPDTFLKEFIKTKPFFSLQTGVQFEWDNFRSEEHIDLIQTAYNLGIMEYNSKLSVPLGLRWNLNLSKNKNISLNTVNINKQSISGLSMFVGAGAKLSFLLDARRTFYIDSIGNPIKWDDTAKEPYPAQKISSLRHLVTIDAFAEFGLRIRINDTAKMPQYMSISLKYNYPFLSNIPAKAVLDDTGKLPASTSAASIPELYSSVYATGHRDIFYHQSFGELMRSISVELHRHSIINKK